MRHCLGRALAAGGWATLGPPLQLRPYQERDGQSRQLIEGDFLSRRSLRITTRRAALRLKDLIARQKRNGSVREGTRCARHLPYRERNSNLTIDRKVIFYRKRRRSAPRRYKRKPRTQTAAIPAPGIDTPSSSSRPGVDVHPQAAVVHPNHGRFPTPLGRQVGQPTRHREAGDRRRGRW